MQSLPPIYSSATNEKKYSPPWEDLSIIGIAGSSGSGKTSVAMEIDSYYKTLTPEQHEKAHRNEYDFDCPEALDFDALVQTLRDLKRGKRANIPVYSFKDHQRQPKTTPLYSPHVLILEGILALHDPRIVEMLDVKIFVEADMDVCLGRRNMVVKHIQRRLQEKSEKHNADLAKLRMLASEDELSSNVIVMKPTPQFVGMNTILQDPSTEQVDFVFYFDRLASLLIERALDFTQYVSAEVTTPQQHKYRGLLPSGIVSAVSILRGGSCLETALKRTIPDCITGRILIQTNEKTSEPELHYLKLPAGIEEHSTVMLLDPQMSSGGAALMAVRVLVDHGVEENKIVFVTCAAGKRGLQRLTSVYPEVKVVVGRIEEEEEPRWLEKRYFGC
ncbi:Uridine kinase [Rasamsonia emersonii CBS 393.64]|uniref:uridine/cytidine kinase n=1 Tax=Rasamsonia emersonii (strain ATCC 16479 / CBS 393.64 / IMI 116815) TaxID=1408163 RepID=A0A0F4YFX5_RASE3|nr:Uridine kinase [Rasamsonia emersonii CBS 393.64]KKA17025.1 Uridine kinase [Rasamsonia emersonii CBS 393.64]